MSMAALAQRLLCWAAMTTIDCTACPLCTSPDVKAVNRKTITVCHCRNCKAVWHVLPDLEPTAA